MKSSDERVWRPAARFALALTAAIVLLTFRRYGVSWDEEVQSQYGQAIYDYYISGFTDRRYDQIFNLYLYGGMFDGLAAWINAYTPFDIYATRHLLNASVGLIGLWGTWRLGRLIGGEAAGFASLVLLLFTPMYYGHMFNNPKDIPFAAGVVWILYYMAKSLRSFPHVSRSLVLKLGTVLGLTLGVRVGGVMLLIFWIIALEALAMSMIWPDLRRFPEKELLRRAFRLDLLLARLIIPAAVISYSVMLLCWPWAQEAPLTNPLKALMQFSNFPNYVEVLLNGVTYPSTELPWYYLPVYFGVQLPLPHILLIVSGAGLLPSIMRNLKPKTNRYVLLLLLLTAFAPPFFAIVKKPALYDGVRHFIFTLPPLCVLAALALRRMAAIFWKNIRETCSRRLRIWIGAAAALTLVIIAAFHVRTYALLHPYEYIYLNTIAGGVKGAYGRYELDYWGSSFKEAAERLQELVNLEGGVPAGKIIRIAICGPWSGATLYLPPDYAAVEADKPAEFFLSTTRWQCQNMRSGEEIIRVERLGAPLSVVKDLRNEKDYKPE